MDKTKKCFKCGKELPATTEFFHIQKQNSDGLDGRCKDCKRKYAQNYRKKKSSSGNGRQKKTIWRSNHNKSSIPKINDTILLDQQILKAIKKSVANQIINIIEEAFA